MADGQPTPNADAGVAQAATATSGEQLGVGRADAEPANARDQVLIHTIQASVEAFLKGEYEEEEDLEAEETAEQHQAAERQEERLAKGRESDAKEEQEAATADAADGDRGFDLDAWAEEMPLIHCRICAALAQLNEHRVQPTVGALKKLLRDRGMDEKIVRAVVVILADEPSMYTFLRPGPPELSLGLDVADERLEDDDGGVEEEEELEDVQFIAHEEAETESMSMASVSRGPRGPPELEALTAEWKKRGITTLMVRNIPKTVTKQRLLDELKESNFSKSYDFCYMPSDFGKGESKGYAFVNFTSHEAVVTFMETWHGNRRFDIASSDPALNVTTATTQGKEQNAKRWDAPRMKRVRNPALRPLVLSPGAEAEPAAPTK